MTAPIRDKASHQYAGDIDLGVVRFAAKKQKVTSHTPSIPAL